MKKDKKDGKVKKDDISKACQGKIDKKDIEEDLKKLEDLGIVSAEINPKTKQKQFDQFDPKENYEEP